ncbi:hypothetical protein ABZX51_005728 [Aspergillus tubingensis]
MDPQSAIPPNDTAAEESPAREVHTEFRYIEAYEDVCDRCDLFNMQNAMSQCRSSPAPTPEATAAPSPAASPNTEEATLRDARAPETAEGAEMLYALGLEDSASRRSESGSPATEEERRTIRAPFLILAKRAREEFEIQQTDRASEE